MNEQRLIEFMMFNASAYVNYKDDHYLDAFKVYLNRLMLMKGLANEDLALDYFLNQFKEAVNA